VCQCGRVGMSIEDVRVIATALGASFRDLDDAEYMYEAVFAGNRPYWISTDSSGKVIFGQKLIVVFEIFSYVFARNTGPFLCCND